MVSRTVANIFCCKREKEAQNEKRKKKNGFDLFSKRYSDENKASKASKAKQMAENQKISLSVATNENGWSLSNGKKYFIFFFVFWVKIQILTSFYVGNKWRLTQFFRV